MNAQRNVIYTRRHHALMGERIGIDIMNMIYDSVEDMVDSFGAPEDYQEFRMKVFTVFAIDMPFTDAEYRSLDRNEMIDRIYKAAVAALRRKGERMAEVALPVFRSIVEQHGAKGMVRVPITDGKRVFGITVDVEESVNAECKNIAKAWQKAILLMSIDESWKEHLRELDQLRQSVQNASYEQKDPLLIYKLESFNLFKTMLSTMNNKAIAMLMRGQIPVQQPDEQQQQQQQPAQPQVSQAPREMPRRPQQHYTESRESYPGAAEQRAAMQSSHQQRRPTQPLRVGPKVGRNDPCPCGSGKKYKDCHGKNA